MTTTRSESSKDKAKGKTTQKASADAIALLKADHRKVEELFSEFEKSRSADKKAAIVETICNELTVHAELEETQFYPPVQEALGRDGDLVDEARVEHASLKWLIAQLQEEEPDGELYEAKVKVLKEYVAHHVKEEEGEMFPKVRRSDIDTEELGAAMQEAKAKLQSKLKLN